MGGSPAELAASLHAELAKQRHLVRVANITPE
jgi:hypothetical protein